MELISPWETKYKTNDVELQYRWINIGDSLKTCELKAIFYIESSFPGIIENFYDEDKIVKWTVGAKKCRVIKLGSNEWVTYTLFDVPKPFRQQELITRHNIICNSNNLLIKIESDPTFLPENQDINRQKHYEGFWKFTQETNHTIKVEFQSVSYTKPLVPRFIQDPILQKMLAKSFVSFKELSENNENK